MRHAVVLAVIICAVAPLPVVAQAPRENPDTASATITIGGRVLEDQSGQPIRNARIALSPAPKLAPAVALTDGEGRFALIVPAGRYTVGASKTGFARRDAPANESAPLELRLPKGAVIAGRAVDSFGDPVIGGRVMAETWSGPNPSLVAATETDDRGDYRLSGLPAGRFTVAILTTEPVTTVRVTRSGVAGSPGMWKTYYPGVLSVDDAESFQIEPGEERPGIDFILPTDRAVGFGAARTTTTFRIPEQRVADSNGTAVVRGRLTTAGGSPLSHARIDLLTLPRTVGGPPAPLLAAVARSVFSDENGRFELRELPAGRVRLTASKVGYWPVSADSKPLDPADARQTFDVERDETRDHADFTLARWGAVMGRIFDEFGDPMQGASVEVLHIRYEAGRRRLVPASAAPQQTNDLGGYRVYGLAPGQYVVSASVGGVSSAGSSAELPGYGRSYYPGTPNADEALFVAVGPSQDAGPVDFALSRVPTARVSGIALNASGERSAAGSLMLRPTQRSSSPTSVEIGARILPDDTFEFPNVPPGEYVVRLYRGRSRPSAEGEFGALRVAVNGDDVSNLVLQTLPGSTISGKFTFDVADRFKMPSRSLEFSPLAVDVDSAPPQVAVAEVDTSWRFEMTGITGLRRLTLVRPPDGWALKEIRLNGVEVTDQPMMFGRRDQSRSDVEVMLTDRVNEVAALVADDKAHPAAGANLMVFSIDRDKWYPASRFMRRAVAGADGLASIKGLPDGVYYAAAVPRPPDEGEDAWQDPEYLASLLRRATTVTLQGGQKVGPLSLAFRP
jgi:Carboxypeptidase regulatory-like domain